MNESLAYELVNNEQRDAAATHKPFNSRHEGYAVIEEELDELWEAIKSNADNEKLKTEAIHTAAMVLRFIIELTV
jgi:hypothetical protein